MDVAAAVAAAEKALVAIALRGAGGSLHDEVADLATAACSAVASRFFAVGTPRSIGLVGSGPIARLHVAAHRVYYAPRELRCAGPGAEELAREVGGRACSIDEALACDIVCVSMELAIVRAQIRGGTHVNATGLIFDEELRSVAKIAAPGMYGTLAEVAAGLKDGRELDEITLFVAERLPAVEEAVARSQA